MTAGNGAAKTLPQALAADLGRLEDLARNVAEHGEALRKLSRLPDLVIKLAHTIDLTREDQRATLEHVGALTEAVKKLNSSVQLVIEHLVPGDSKPTPPDSPHAKTHLSARRRK